MANLRNEFEFRSALLTALGQEHTEAEAKNEDTWRRKMLDGLGVEYDQNDVNQFGLFREKLIEGVTNKSEGGGGSSDFSIANVTLINTADRTQGGLGSVPHITDDEMSITSAFVRDANTRTVQVVLYKGTAFTWFEGSEITSYNGNITVDDTDLTITGDCSITFVGENFE